MASEWNDCSDREWNENEIRPPLTVMEWEKNGLVAPMIILVFDPPVTGAQLAREKIYVCIFFPVQDTPYKKETLNLADVL